MPELIDTIGWTLLHFLWQGTALAALLAVFLLCCPLHRARLRYGVSCLVLLAMVASVVTTAALHESSPAPSNPQVVVEALPEPAPEPTATSHSFDMTCSAVGTSTAKRGMENFIERDNHCRPGALLQLAENNAQRKEAAHASLLTSTPPPPPAPTIKHESRWDVLVAVWLLGVTLCLLKLLFLWSATQQLRVSQVSPLPILANRVRELSASLGLRRPATILKSAAVVVPTTMGWLRPVVLLPIGSIAGLSREQLDAVIAHELAHIRRHDYLVNLLQHLVEILLFFHPAVWWVSRQIRAEREHCCDDLAVAATKDPLPYAQALTRLEEQRQAAPNLAIAFTGGPLLSRIQRLCGCCPPRRPSRASLPLALLAIALAVPATLVHSKQPPAPGPPKKEGQDPAEDPKPTALPTSEAAMEALRMLHRKEPDAELRYDDFLKLAKLLDEADLITLLDELRGKVSGYARWSRAALYQEYGDRDLEKAVARFMRNQNWHIGSGGESLYALWLNRRPKDPFEAWDFLSSLPRKNEFKRDYLEIPRFVHDNAGWVRMATYRLFKEMTKLDAERAWRTLPGRNAEGELEVSNYDLAVKYSNYDDMLGGFFAGLPNAERCTHYIERFGKMGREDIGIAVATEWMVHDLAAAQKWAPPQKPGGIAAVLVGGVEGNAAHQFARRYPKLALKAIRQKALPKWEHTLAYGLLEGNPHFAPELVKLLPGTLPPQKPVFIPINPDGTIPPSPPTPASAARALASAMSANTELQWWDAFPDPSVSNRPRDLNARYQSLLKGIEAADLGENLQTELRRQLKAHFDEVPGWKPALQ